MCPNAPIVNFLCTLVTLHGTFDWSLIPKNLLVKPILLGVIMTLVLAVLAQFFGAIFGLLLYFIRRSQVAPVRWFGNVYIWYFRGTPLLVQIELLYALIPFFGLLGILNSINFFPAIGFDRVPMDAFIAALVALSLNEGAYMAEIVRAGIDAIDLGQLEAAKSLGMTYYLAMRRIVLPQAARVIIPPLGNEFNSMLKSTSLASAITMLELLQTAREIGTPSFTIPELLIVASIWYLVLTSIWTVIQANIERRLNVSLTDPGAAAPGDYLKRLIGFGGRLRGATAGGAPVDVTEGQGAR
ncbi:MAG TPA: amino acid ABC transporter permease [Ktedonobacterales bacterium]|jgi:polar amino acid transport system permease protein